MIKKFNKPCDLGLSKMAFEELGGLSLGYSYVSVRKISEGLCVMTLKADANFKRKLTCGFKNNIRNLVSFHVSS